MSFFSESPNNPPPPPYVEREEGGEEECTAAPLPTIIAKLASRHDPVKEFAAEIWKNIRMKTLEKINDNKLKCNGGQNRYYDPPTSFANMNHGKYQPSPVQYPYLVAEWAHFREELMQGVECNWVDMGNESVGSRWFVQYRFLSEAEYRGPPSNMVANCYWKEVRDHMKTIEMQEEEMRGQVHAAKEYDDNLKRSVDKIMEIGNNNGKKAETLVLFSIAQGRFLYRKLFMYNCRNIYKLNNARYQGNKKYYDELKKEHLQAIGNPAVLVGDWYVLHWDVVEESGTSCCTIC
jgi:hypothetical protein